MAGNGTDRVVLTENEFKQDEAVRGLREARSRRDSWYNYRSRFGGMADPVLISSYVRNRERIKRAEAETLYEFDWLTARVVDQMANDSTREWIRLTHEKDPDKAEKLRVEDERLNGRGVFEEAIRLSRLHGGNLLVIGAWEGGVAAPEEPLELKRIKNVGWTSNVDRWLTFPIDWYRDPEDPNYGKPETYIIHRLSVVGTAVSTIHETRCLRFDGNPLPPLARIRNWNWGASVIDKVYDALRNWGMSNQAAASIIPSFITYAMKIENLRQLIANEEWTTIQRRVGEAFAQMATTSMMTYGDGEEIQKMGTPISGLPELIDRFMKIVSAAVNIPMSILFQAESGSLGGNASQTDRDNWHDAVGAYQENYLRVRLRRWLDIIGMPIGLKPGEVEFEFVSLKKTSPEQEADLYYKNAQADQIYISTQVVHPEAVALHRFGGQKYNPAPLVVDTDRDEKILEEINKQPIDMGSQDQFRVPFSGDVEPPEGEEGEGGAPGGAEGEGALGGGDLGGGEQPPGVTDSLDSLDTEDEDPVAWYKDQLLKQKSAQDKFDRERPAPPPPPKPRALRVLATRRQEDGMLEAVVEEITTIPKTETSESEVIIKEGAPGSDEGKIDAHVKKPPTNIEPWKNYEHVRIRQQANDMVASGKLKPEGCMTKGCSVGPDKTTKHHVAYDRPDNVIWHCDPHHRELHKSMSKMDVDCEFFEEADGNEGKFDAHVKKPGSRGGHIIGYRKGEPIYGKAKPHVEKPKTLELPPPPSPGTLPPLKAGSTKHQIVKLLSKSPSGMSMRDISTTLKKDPAGPYAAATELIKGGYLVKEGKKYYVLDTSKAPPGTKAEHTGTGKTKLPEWIKLEKSDGPMREDAEKRLGKKLKEARSALKNFVERSVPQVRVHEDAFVSIFGQGRFKNQYETRSSSGMYNPSMRKETELGMLGIPESPPPSLEHRPIYGYLHPPGQLFDEGDEVSLYGSIRITLKDHVKDRATFTVGDSLGAFARPAPFHDPGVESMTRNWAARGGPVIMKKTVEETDVSYVEAQYHGGLSVDDIASVTLPGFDPNPKFMKLLEKKGIPYTLDDSEQ